VDDTNNNTTNTNNAKGPASAVEFEPPLACVRRILKNSLPSSTNVGKDASAAFARASGIFIIYLTACANDFARENRRQTITANDVLAAIKVGFKILWSVSSWFNIYFTPYPIL
jgi:histone H3/H4